MKYNGKDFLLQVKIADVWTSCVSDRSTSLKIGNEQIDTTSKTEAPWRELSACGIRSADIAASGIYCDRDVLDTLMSACFDGGAVEVKVIHGPTQDKILEGTFRVVSMERTGEYNGAEQYSLFLSLAFRLPPQASLTASKSIGFHLDIAPDNYISSVCVVGRTVYFTGGFSTVNGLTRVGLASYNMDSGELDPSLSISVVNGSSLATDGTWLYVAGDMIGGRFMVARINLATKTIDTSFPRSMVHASGGSIAVIGDYAVLVHASAATVGGVASVGMVYINRSTLAVVAVPVAGGQCGKCAAGGNRLVVTGSFTSIAGEARDGSAIFDDTISLTNEFVPHVVNGTVGVSADGSLMVIGNGYVAENPPGEQQVVYLYRRGVGCVTLPGMNSNANGRAAFKGNLVSIGGYFTSVDGVSRSRFVEINCDDLTITDRSINIPSGTVFEVSYADDNIITCGTFTVVDGKSYPRIYQTEIPSLITAIPSWSGDILTKSLTRIGPDGVVAMPITESGVPSESEFTIPGDYACTLTVTDTAGQAAQASTAAE